MVPSDYPLICKPFSDERAHETRRRVTPSHVSVFLLGYQPESAPDRQGGARGLAGKARGRGIATSTSSPSHILMWLYRGGRTKAFRLRSAPGHLILHAGGDRVQLELVSPCSRAAPEPPFGAARDREVLPARGPTIKAVGAMKAANENPSHRCRPSSVNHE